MVYVTIVDTFVADGAEGIILGCTEIGRRVGRAHHRVPVFETARTHEVAAVDRAVQRRVHLHPVALHRATLMCRGQQSSPVRWRAPRQPLSRSALDGRGHYLREKRAVTSVPARGTA